MSTFFEIVSIVGIAGLVGVGIWVGNIRANVTQNRNDIDDIKATIKSDHDLLIEIRAKLDFLVSGKVRDTEN